MCHRPTEGRQAQLQEGEKHLKAGALLRDIVGWVSAIWGVEWHGLVSRVVLH